MKKPKITSFDSYIEYAYALEKYVKYLESGGKPSKPNKFISLIGKIIGRTIGFVPFLVLGIFFFFKHLCVYMWNFVAYGGEVIAYRKGEKVTMYELYKQLDEISKPENEQ